VAFEVEASWWTFAAIALVIAIDASRVVVSARAARVYRSVALQASALHFGSDLAGTLAVLAGLSAVALGWPEGDAVAALFVSGLVILAAGRLLRRNVGVLMDQASEDAERAARAAIAALDPPVELRRLRLREAGGAHFADVVIGIAPGAAVGQGHAAADRVEDALREQLIDADVVVHVEPRDSDAELRERTLAAALGVPDVRELHNLVVLDVDGRVEVSLHLKLPGDVSLADAHDVAEEVERAILAAVPEVENVQTHLEPLSEAAAARPINVDPAAVERCVREETGAAPREVRFVRTDKGIVAFLTLALAGDESLADAHMRAIAVEERVRAAVPGIADVVIHTEP
jgi:divalent metal cation (Fe/Co/Zn/Cd) transporter